MNLTLKDQKLILDAATPFTILQNSLPAVREEFARIQPLENEACSKGFGFFATNFLPGWRLKEYVRAAVREKIGHAVLNE